MEKGSKDFNYRQISKQLAINYFNVSIRHDSTGKEEKEKFQNVLNKVFGEGLSSTPNVHFEESYFGRNVLVIGAGASRGQIDTVKDGAGAIEAIENSIGFTELLKYDKKFVQRYKSLASHYNKKVYGPKIGIETINKQLGFEGRLSMLLNFYDKQDVLDEINKILNFKFLPVKLYEIIAHFFKHRLIDVIINFNFDELLDNAIDDEMGNTSYFKIVHDSDCKPINEIMDKNMLKTPLYIKPHGTISSKTSLLFTKEHYIDISEDMKTLMYDVLMGKIGEKQNKIIENFNVMFAGFAMESIELNDILFTQIKRKADGYKPSINNINYYILTDKNKEIKDKFEAEFNIWQTKLVADGDEIKIDFINTDYECNAEYSLDYHFENIFDQTSSYFQKPFTPPGLSSHRTLSLLFPVDKIKGIGDELLERKSNLKYAYYLKCRAIFHFLYDLIKWKGVIALNVVTNERPGKYYREYLKALTNENRYKQPDLVGLLKEDAFLRELNLTEESDIIYKYKKVYENGTVNDCTDENFNSKIFIEEICDKMIEFCLISDETEGIKDSIRKTLVDQMIPIYNSGHYEVSPVYDDSKHARFRPFWRAQLMPTSLTLTYKFFQFCVLNKSEEWDEMWFASDSGTPIINLHRYSSHKPTYLEDMVSMDKKIKLLCSFENKKVLVEADSEAPNEAQINLNFLLKKIFAENIEINMLKAQHNIHHMALFLKKSAPKFGFYFFKLEGKNRINPVFFESKNGHNDTENLKKLKKLFTDQFSKGTKILS